MQFRASAQRIGTSYEFGVCGWHKHNGQRVCAVGQAHDAHWCSRHACSAKQVDDVAGLTGIR